MPIRVAQPVDAPTIATLHQQLTIAMAAIDANVIQPLAAPDISYIARYIVRDDADILVHTDANNVIDGFCILSSAVFGTAVAIVPHHFAYLVDLYVAAAARNHGIGEALLTATDQWTHDHQLEFVQLGVLAANTAARKLYVRHGYQDSLVTLVKRPPRV